MNRNRKLSRKNYDKKVQPHNPLSRATKRNYVNRNRSK